MCGCFVDDGQTVETSGATGPSETEDTGTNSSGNEATEGSTTAEESASETLATGSTEDSIEPVSSSDPSLTDSSSSTTNEPTTSTTDDPSSVSESEGFMCEEPFEDCNGEAEDECEANLDESGEHCGMCDNPCAGQCVGGLCQQSRIVFVTQDTHNGNLGGLEGADTICNEAANDANLPGNYYAWLSTSDSSPSERFEPTNRSFVMPNNVMVANNWDDLIDGMLITGIGVDQFGGPVEVAIGCSSGYVWSATTTSGELNGIHHCLNWTTFSPSFEGHTGIPGLPDATWTESPCLPQGCAANMHLYCFQQ